MLTSARYRQVPWPALRNAVENVLRQHRPHTYWGQAFFDLTDSLIALRAAQRELRIGVSLHAYVLFCLARAAADHPGVLTYRRGAQLLTFEDADVATLIDRRGEDGVRIPIVYTFRAAQDKSLAAINWELRQVLRGERSDLEAVRLRRRAARLPGLLRRLVGWRMTRDPLLLRRYHGTIGLTSLHRPGLNRPFFALPPNICTLTLAVGSLFDQLQLDAEGQPRRRRYLCLTAGVDHAVVDGAEQAAFTQRLGELLEGASGLGEAFVDETRALQREAQGLPRETDASRQETLVSREDRSASQQETGVSQQQTGPLRQETGVLHQETAASPRETAA